MNKINYVIIGSSAAGIGAAAKLRDLDPQGTITCLTTEQVMPYNRCLLADVLATKKTPEAIAVKSTAFFNEKNITIQLNSHVEAIDANNQHVITQQGETIAYDKLLIATGRSGWTPDLPGNQLVGVMSFYGLTDVHAIMTYIKANDVQHIVVVGAGLSGLECADALKPLVKTVTIIERTTRTLPHQLNDDGSRFLITLAQAHGVAVQTNVTVAALEGSTHIKQVILSDGSALSADLVIFAIGGRTNSKIAGHAGLTLHNNHAIDVSSRQQTSNDHIYAAGDVATVIDQITGTKAQSCLWPDAVKQGMVAASNMTGTEKHYDGTVLVTSSTIFGTTFVTAGAIAHPPTGLKLLVKETPSFYHALLTDQDNVLKGFALVGNVDNIGALRKKLLEKTPLF